MKPTKIHLLAIDVDGTLLNSAKQITDATAKAIAAAREAAVQFAAEAVLTA